MIESLECENARLVVRLRSIAPHHINEQRDMMNEAAVMLITLDNMLHEVNKDY